MALLLNGCIKAVLRSDVVWSTLILIEAGLSCSGVGSFLY